MGGMGRMDVDIWIDIQVTGDCSLDISKITNLTG